MRKQNKIEKLKQKKNPLQISSQPRTSPQDNKVEEIGSQTSLISEIMEAEV